MHKQAAKAAATKTAADHVGKGMLPNPDPQAGTMGAAPNTPGDVSVDQHYAPRQSDFSPNAGQ